MQYITHYTSPLGDILLAADDIGLCGLWFAGQKYYADGLDPEHEEKETPVLMQAEQWLDRYFRGENPGSFSPLHMQGTDFQKTVWQILLRVPYGRTVTYGEIAERAAREKGLTHMSAQAVGSAVGRNRIAVIIPCHRAVGKDGSLTGYAGGLDRKAALLKLEKAWHEGMYIPE